MLTVHRVVLPLRVFLVVLFGVLVMLQTFSLPGQFAHMAKESPDMAYLRWPATAVGFNASDPGLPLLLFLWLVGLAVVGLLIVVLRALLRQATTLQTDMEAVI